MKKNNTTLNLTYPNESNIKNKHVVEKTHGMILLTSSLLFGLNSIYGYYNYLHNNMKFYEIIFTNTVLFFTSINLFVKQNCVSLLHY
jgi:hypothetical protein